MNILEITPALELDPPQLILNGQAHVFDRLHEGLDILDATVTERRFLGDSGQIEVSGEDIALAIAQIPKPNGETRFKSGLEPRMLQVAACGLVVARLEARKLHAVIAGLGFSQEAGLVSKIDTYRRIGEEIGEALWSAGFVVPSTEGLVQTP